MRILAYLGPEQLADLRRSGEVATDVGQSFWAYRLTVLQGAPFKPAAHQTGDSSGRRLRGAIRNVLGCMPRQLAELSRGDVVHRVITSLGAR